MSQAQATTVLHGVGVSSGRASGPVARAVEVPATPSVTTSPADAAVEAARIGPAAEAVSGALLNRAESVTGESRAVLETTAAMAADPALLAQAEELVHWQSLSAESAVHEAASGFSETLRATGGYLAERVKDVEDVRDRIVAELTGQPVPGVPVLREPSVLIARDLAPADTADLDPALVLALVTEDGGPTSHTAILARSLGIPAIVAARGVLAADPQAVEVDGDSGEVVTSAEPLPTVVAVRERPAEWDCVGRTADGHSVGVLANVGSPGDATSAVAAGAGGVGLFRTEFCFLDTAHEPTVEAQRAAYAAVLGPLTALPVVVRTLDAGADKPMPFLHAGFEPNPALGVRGLRVAGEHPHLLGRQLDAIAAAASDTGAQVSVMAPMVATPDEAASFAERARAAGLNRAGVMIEVPAAALHAREILDAVDFVSVGTNDLAQYTFAADRMLGALATLNDPWQPALLRLVEMLGKAGRDTGKPVGVCGEAAADPVLAGVLVGLGVTSVSMAASAIPAVGSRITQHARHEWEHAARSAISTPGAEQAREAARAALG
ncbi:phosphoenolpyruvate--protein phosphotransferase [Allosaccharopolyspora coralli]|uniref:Phosphoenolpyruvate-protein phosphotransferase n=1 Tax=Allosaccharopolyspora coralli TaxID=2665642 RepID=A0A5Q3QG63_9PSEU|nr:phosphoenolpyruvate--protein phosphotransferase [Allosaccharopolyspora coralli]QGK69807.1 phosphoenolpyruvate--protein phosphotransferase [Allosaccharopolyspora coralli]